MSGPSAPGGRAAREKAADLAAARATARTAPDLAGRRLDGHGDAQAGFEAVRRPMQAALGHDFSRVRIHARGPAAESARALGARAFAYGDLVAFAPGEWSPGTLRGIDLIAHELAHVAAQAREGTRRVDPKTLDEEVDEELAKHATDPKSLDPGHKDYAFTLQGYGFGITHSQMDLLPEPTDAAKKKEWRRRFQKAEVVAGRILDRSGPQVDQKESRAQMLTSDLAAAGFVTEAMTLARRFTDANLRGFVYDSVLGRPDKVSEAQLVEITRYLLANNKLADHPVAEKLDDKGAYTRQLGAGAVNAVLAELVKAYRTDTDLPATVARIIFFDNRLQAGFTTAMIQAKEGSLLRAVSEQPYFAAGAQIQTAPGTTVSPTDPQVAWAIGNRQRVTVDEIVTLVTAAGAKLTAPTAYDAATLRAWLEANTEKIGAALKKQHPNDPAVAETMLRNITNSFMWHVDPDTENVAPDKTGRISGLKAAAGAQKAQLKVDCDVLATYSVRLLLAAGFTPVGYMAVVPTDKNRAAHAMALVQHGQTYRAISNMATRSFAVTPKKDDALTALRDFGIEEAYDPDNPLAGYKIYYRDTDAKGTLPDAVLNEDPAALQAGLSR